MKRKRNLYAGVSAVGLLVALGFGQHWLETTAAAQAKGGVQAPRFEVDPLWPKPLPNHWLLGMTIGVSVDSRNHVWIIHRSSATLGNNEKGHGARSADVRALLQGRAARASSSMRPARLSAPGAAPDRASTGRTRTTASPSNPTARCGSAGTARTTVSC